MTDRWLTGRVWHSVEVSAHHYTQRRVEPAGGLGLAYLRHLTRLARQRLRRRPEALRSRVAPGVQSGGPSVVSGHAGGTFGDTLGPRDLPVVWSLVWQRRK